jgi:(1->4)-alpha-D-glucan 1-alpha-D-glucosylmutase
MFEKRGLVNQVGQGCEAIELMLVDPDNRRAVDFERRQAWLATAQALAASDDRRSALRELLQHGADGRAKFWATWRVLQLRASHAPVLRDGAYLPLEVRGDKARHVLAFARHDGQRWVVAVVTRLAASMGLAVGEAPVADHWGDTCLVWPDSAAARPTALVCAISGQRHAWLDETLSLAQVLRDFPVAALGSAED